MKDIDILVFGAHPDDVELACAGTILLQISLGYKVGIIDLTRGELGTRGSAIIRDAEAKLASQKMGISFRDNLEFKDGFFENNKKNKLEIIKKIRHYRPKIILCNAPDDRHPDHGRGSNLVFDSSFLSGLDKIATSYNGVFQKPYRANVLYHYIQHKDLRPDFIVDVSPFMSKKMDIIKSYKSQFYNQDSNEKETLISQKKFLELIVNRASDLGGFISADYAEGFLARRYIGVDNLFSVI